jgi:hypothetical protein
MFAPQRTQGATDSFLLHAPGIGTLSSIYKEIQQLHNMDKLCGMYMIFNIIHNVTCPDEIHGTTSLYMPTYHSIIMIGWFLSVVTLYRRLSQFHLHFNEMDNSSSTSFKSCCTLDTMSSDMSSTNNNNDEISNHHRCMDDEKVGEYFIEIPQHENNDWGYFADWMEEGQYPID